MTQSLLYQNEKSLFVVSAIISILFWILVIFGTLGVALMYGGIFYISFLFAHSALISYLKGTAVKISDKQFPDLYEQLTNCCKRLDIQEIPETYVLHGDGAFNAFATRFLGRNFVVLFSDVVDALEKNKHALNFYIGHELGHIHRKHLVWAPILFPALLLPLLGAAYSRAREYTCDNYGFSCCPNPQDAIYGLAALSAGANRWQTLQVSNYIAQAQATGGFWMSFNELIADYPWLVKRMSRLVAMAKGETADMPSRNLFAWLFAMFIPRIGAGAGAGGILVVIAIIGIMAAIAIPQFAAYREKAQQQASPSLGQSMTPDSEFKLESFGQ
ncbi:MAG: M48 family metallopeptidase [Thermodesulfobacteriota bacterium]